MKGKSTAISITLDEHSAAFIEAYAKVFGTNLHYVVMKFINKGITEAIKTEILSKEAQRFQGRAMTSLSQTALEFAREVLGWEDAYHSGDGYIVSPCRAGSGVWTPADSASLDSVMAAVRGWCKDKLPDFYVLDITYYKPVPEVVDDIYIVTLRTNRDTHEAKSLNLCHALLAACVEAARKLKSA